MKSPRDILVAGIGFLLGMVFCYFLTAASERGAVTDSWVAFRYHGDADSGTNAVDLRTIKLNWN